MNGKGEFACYTDGSCKAGEGSPGGWGFHVRPPVGSPIEGHGSALRTLAKVMEYRAVAEAIDVLPEGASAIVFSDNQSLVEGMPKNLERCRSNALSKIDPLVVDSLERIVATITDRRLSVRWQWVRAHNGNAGNERADQLAAQGAREAKIK